MEALSRYPIPVIAMLTDVQRGLPALCGYLPTLKDVAEHGRKFEAEYHDRLEREAKYISRQQRIALAGPSREGPAKYNPFPKLSEAFADSPELLKRPFDTLRQASRMLAVEGPSAALAVLQAGRDLGKYNPPVPRFDIADFPEAERT